MIRISLASLLLLVGTAFSQAATIVSYNLQGAAGNQASQAPAVSAAFTTGVNLTRGAGLVGSAASNSFSASGWESAVAAPTSTEYFEFGFNVDPGYVVDVSELYVGTRSSGTGPGTIGLFSSVDSFAAPIATWAAGNATFVNQIVNLSALPDLAGNVRFRLYEVGNSAANGSGATSNAGTFRVTAYFANGVFDRDFQIVGTVNAIPEASSVVLVMTGMLGLAGVAQIRRSVKK
jgi:hypothetical protein